MNKLKDRCDWLTIWVEDGYANFEHGGGQSTADLLNYLSEGDEDRTFCENTPEIVARMENPFPFRVVVTNASLGTDPGGWTDYGYEFSTGNCQWKFKFSFTEDVFP